jgi:hypothetical protein
VFRLTPQHRNYGTLTRARALVCAVAAVLSCSAALPIGVACAESSETGNLVMVIESSTFQLSVLDSRSGERSPTIRVALGSPESATPTGRFPLERIILSPSWRPGVVAKRAGAEPEAASLDTPMGAVKIPFAAKGVISLHGGGDHRVLGKPISAGCVRATDADLLRVVAWLDGRDALESAKRVQNGELHRRFRRPIDLVVR